MNRSNIIIVIKIKRPGGKLLTDNQLEIPTGPSAGCNCPRMSNGCVGGQVRFMGEATRNCDCSEDFQWTRKLRVWQIIAIDPDGDTAIF